MPSARGGLERQALCAVVGRAALQKPCQNRHRAGAKAQAEPQQRKWRHTRGCASQPVSPCGIMSHCALSKTPSPKTNSVASAASPAPRWQSQQEPRHHVQRRL